MNKELELALRKQRLQLQCAAERMQFAQHVAGLAPVWRTIGVVEQGLLWLRRRPYYALGAAALVGLGRPRFLVRLAIRAWGIWRVVSSLRPGSSRSTILNMLLARLASRFTRSA